MRRSAMLLMILLALVCGARAGQAQDVSAVAERVKSELQAKPSCWRLNREQERKLEEWTDAEQDWICRQEDAVTIYLYQTPSEEAAAKMLTEMRQSPVQAPGQSVDDHKFGDESFVRTYPAYSQSSYVFFRQGNIVVRIDSNMLRNPTSARTLTNALCFAQLVSAQIASINKP